ncbi:MAG: response regulator [Pseudanabaena sp.]|jgi:CheY-like chemotaxis protein
MRSFDPILLVEDDFLDIMTLKRGLRDIKADNPLHVRNDGESALDFLRDPNNLVPALILLDLNMPRMNGLEFLKILKSDPDWCKIPVVVLTTSQEEQDRLASFELSAAGYIVKPLEYPAFVEKLQILYQYWRLSEIPSFVS